MATYKISIYERMCELTSDAATCELPDDFGESAVLDVAYELLEGGIYRNSDALDAIDQAADGSFEIEAHSDGWQDGIFCVDLINMGAAGPIDDVLESFAEIVASIEIERI